MHWFAGASYLTAGAVSQFSGRSPMLAFISIVLAVWLGIVVVLESRSARPALDSIELNGWSTALSARTVESIKEFDQLAFLAALMRLALIFFGFLLMTWAFLL